MEYPEIYKPRKIKVGDRRKRTLKSARVICAQAIFKFKFLFGFLAQGRDSQI